MLAVDVNRRSCFQFQARRALQGDSAVIDIFYFARPSQTFETACTREGVYTQIAAVSSYRTHTILI